MSTKRFWISTLWLAIGGAVGAILLWGPNPLQISSWWWLAILLIVAIAFNRVPNWWASTSGFFYFVGTWAVGGLITWGWASIQEPVCAWWSAYYSVIPLWFVPVVLLTIVGLLLSSCYLPMEFYFNQDEFQDEVVAHPGQLWRAAPPQNILVFIMSVITLGGWFLLLLPSGYLDTRTIDRAIYALLFAWIMVWLGKLEATLKARANPEILHPRYKQALLAGEYWADVRHKRNTLW
ncbi:hypothetical protein JXA59_01155 [Patescibacteria group bacterium]|nr:hypothetical protein [Patescibacteria group bacterium]